MNVTGQLFGSFMSRQEHKYGLLLKFRSTLHSLGKLADSQLGYYFFQVKFHFLIPTPTISRDILL